MFQFTLPAYISKTRKDQRRGLLDQSFSLDRTMAPRKIIDSHIHLWPEEMSNEQGHSWMTSGMPLAKPHLLSHYRKAARQDEQAKFGPQVEGVVYVETDVRYDQPHGDVAVWAKGPLDEIRFLRQAVEGRYDNRDAELLLGLVPWAPMDQPTPVLEEYLRLAEEAAGQETWSRVKGFRFLLQFIHNQARFEKLVLSDAFIANLKVLGARGFSFDIGVDQRSGGAWQLETVAQAMEKAHKGAAKDQKVIFIINHLCKPDFEAGKDDFRRWCDSITSMSQLSNTFMKLSGAFSELPSRLREPKDVARHLRPWIKHLLSSFGPSRIMFGSDWPVCNVAGPLGEESWVAWKDVVAAVLDDEEFRLTEEDCDSILSGTARRAYRLS